MRVCPSEKEDSPPSRNTQALRTAGATAVSRMIQGLRPAFVWRAGHQSCTGIYHQYRFLPVEGHRSSRTLRSSVLAAASCRKCLRPQGSKPDSERSRVMARPLPDQAPGVSSRAWCGPLSGQTRKPATKGPGSQSGAAGCPSSEVLPARPQRRFRPEVLPSQRL
jgi:hypothetical protein